MSEYSPVGLEVGATAPTADMHDYPNFAFSHMERTSPGAMKTTTLTMMSPRMTRIREPG